MKKSIALILALLAATSVSAQPSPISRVRIYTFAAPVAQAGDLFGGSIPAALADSVDDIKVALEYGRFYRFNTKSREEAAIVVEVVGREVADNGEYRVRVHVTMVDGRESDLTGTSTHQWKQAAKQIADQLVAYAKTHEKELLSPKS